MDLSLVVIKHHFSSCGKDALRFLECCSSEISRLGSWSTPGLPKHVNGSCTGPALVRSRPASGRCHLKILRPFMRAFYFILSPVIFLFLFAFVSGGREAGRWHRPWGPDVGAGGPPSCAFWPGGLWFSCWVSQTHVWLKLCSLKGVEERRNTSPLS